MNDKTVQSMYNRITIDLIYFFGSALFFYLQLNIAIGFAFYSTLSLKEVVLALLFFKTGEFLHERFDGGDSRLWILLLCISALAVIMYPKMIVLYMVFSLSMMKIRDAARVYSSKAIKVYGRVLGFVLAPFSYPYISGAVVLLFVFTAYINRNSFYKEDKLIFHRIKNKKNRIGYTIMGTHHAHYFVYAYTIPFIFAQDPNIPVYLTGLIFYLGWAAYNAYEKLLKPRWKYFIIGHIIAAFSLIGLYYMHNTVPILICWFLTGLGGGTIYMLPELLDEKGSSINRELRIAEAIGHMTGISLWGMLSFLYGLRLALLAGCTLSFITVLLAVVHSNKSKVQSETIKLNV